MSVGDLIDLLEREEPEREVVVRISGGCLNILWVAEEEDEGALVVTIGTDG